jgi:Calx-beta domain
MRYQPAHTAKDNRSLLSALTGAPTPVRVALSTAVAASLAFVPLVAFASPASAAPGDLTMVDESATEGTDITFTLSRQAGAVGAVAYTVDTAAGTATEGTDYSGVHTTVSFPDDTGGGTDVTRTIVVHTTGDTTYENDETFHLDVKPSGGGATIESAMGTILDDDAAPTYTLSNNGPVNEAAGTATITATLTQASGKVSTIPVQTVDGVGPNGALASNDYTALPIGAQITIPAGQTTGTIQVPITNDTTYELQQSFQVETVGAEANTSPTTLGSNTTTVTIDDNDQMPKVTLGGAGQAAEGQDLSFPLTLSNKSEPAVTVVANTADGTATAGSDYTAATNQTVTFGPYTTSQALVVATNDDNLFEVSPETFTASIASPTDATLGATTSATGGITDNDTAPTVTLSPTSVTEGDSGTSTQTFTVTLNQAAGRPVTVNYATSDGTALATKDYTAASGSIVIPAGQTTGTFTVDVLGDTIHEGDEAFTVTLSSPDATVSAGGSLGANSVTITDDDALPTFSVNDVTSAEGNSGANAKTFTVTLSNASSTPIDMVYNTTDGTAVSTTSGIGANDFVGVTGGTFTIPALATTKTFTVTVNGDTAYENNETATVAVDLAPGETDASSTVPLGQQHTGTLTITNDDAKPTLALNTQTGVEGTNLRVTATVTGSTQVPVPLTVTATGDSDDGLVPASSDDYDLTDVAGTVPAMTASGTKLALGTIELFRDNVYESTEAIKATVSGANAPVSSTYNITDADEPPTLSIGDESIREDEGSVQLAVHVNFTGDTTSSERDITVPYRTVDGSAMAPEDYVAKNSTLIIPAGTTTGNINVTINDDALHETDQTFAVRLGPPAPSGVEVSDGIAFVNIQDDNDVATAPTLWGPATRQGSGTVTLSGTAGQGSTVQLWATTVADNDPHLWGTTTANAKGQYSFARYIRTGYKFWVKADGIMSPGRIVRVTQDPVVAGGSGGKGKVSLKVYGDPQRPGQTVWVQRANANGSWTTVAKGKTAGNNTYSVTLSGLKSGSYYTFRAYIPSDPGHGELAGYSPTKRIGIR